MKIVVGRDEATKVTEEVVKDLKRRGYEVRVLNVKDWPEVARELALEVTKGKADQGVLFCWTGTGTTMAANKIAGARAALAWEPWIAKGARLWNDANILVMSSKRTTPNTAKRILDTWFSIKKSDPEEEKNISRLKKLDSK
jgi:ribose 5-phosphate isomerase B